jgi:hypothetical protein
MADRDTRKRVPGRSAIRVWTPDGEAWRCIGCTRYLARLTADRYELPDGTGGALPATLRCPGCGKRNHGERIIVRTVYRLT